MTIGPRTWSPIPALPKCRLWSTFCSQRRLSNRTKSLVRASSRRRPSAAWTRRRREERLLAFVAGPYTLMLDAFIRKGVRRILSGSEPEHKNYTNEDAITSMVFTPLRYMAPDEALNCLGLILMRPLADLKQSRPISSFSVEFWPEGLRSKSTTTIGARTRCEPDLVARFEFTEGLSLMIIGEMKWDSYPSKAELEAQIARERHAIKEHYPKADILMFALVKSKKRYMQGERFNRVGCLVFEWTEFHQLLNRYLRRSPARASAQWRWACDISNFLKLAEQTIFTGVKDDYGSLPAADLRTVFYRTGFRGFSMDYGDIPSAENECFYSFGGGR
jgi:hypothetical protein